MPSSTEVANHALDLINQPPIFNLDDVSDPKSARCKRMYEMALTFLLEKDHWKFAYKRLSIAVDATSPVSGWTYQYTLPADCRKPVRINDDDTQPWTEENGKILTDSASPIILEYIQNVADPNRWHAAFTEAFTHYLAAQYAMAFPQDNDKAAGEMQLYKDSLYEAQAKNGSTGTQPRPQVTTLTTAIRRY